MKLLHNVKGCIMARKQSPILDLHDSSNYWFVVQWISNRIQEESIDVSGTSSLYSTHLVKAIDTDLDTTQIRQKVADSWRELEKLWINGWEKETNNKLPNADEYFTHLINRTNMWLDEHFPANNDSAGRERKRLLAAVRQQRLREKRKGYKTTIQVSISGSLYKMLYTRWEIPEAKRHDFVRASLQLILENPDLLEKAKDLACIKS